MSVAQLVNDPRVFHANHKYDVNGVRIQHKIWREGNGYLLEIFDSRFYYPVIVRARTFYSLIQYLDPFQNDQDWKVLFD